MKLQKDDFKEISIMGRVAYGICCLENALVHYSKDIADWRKILDLLWEFPACEGFIIEPTEEWVHYLPEVIFEYTYEEKRTKGFTEEEYNHYKQLYENTEKPILKIIDTVDYLARENFNAGVKKYAPETLDILQEILDIMYSNNIEMPDIELFRQFEFDVKPIQDYGWGHPFKGKEMLSRFN